MYFSHGVWTVNPIEMKSQSKFKYTYCKLKHLKIEMAINFENIVRTDVLIKYLIYQICPSPNCLRHFNDADINLIKSIVISYTNSQLTLNNINWQISPTYDMRHNSFQMHKTWSDFCNSGKPQSQYIVHLFYKYVVIECYGGMLKCLDKDLDHILWQLDSFKCV